MTIKEFKQFLYETIDDHDFLITDKTENDALEDNELLFSGDEDKDELFIIKINKIPEDIIKKALDLQNKSGGKEHHTQLGFGCGIVLSSGPNILKKGK